MLAYRKPGGLLAPGGDMFRVVASGRVVGTGSAGSEYCYFNMPTLGGAVGDVMIIFNPYDGGNGAGSGGVSSAGAGWTSGTDAWMYANGTFAYKTLDATDIAATAMRFLARSAYSTMWVILRNLVGTSLTATLKQKLEIPTDATSVMTFPGYTKSGLSKGHIMLVYDRDNLSTWNAPAGHTPPYNVAQDGLFVGAISDLRNPSNYQSLSNLVWTMTGTQTYGQTGLLFELT
ncbi:hypothetical protein O4H52_01130 [Sphingomonadaceae bacterium G21617-S1]|nr:hypothetical protein [Sphingomonadaceae bacterium G21617-S1]